MKTATTDLVMGELQAIAEKVWPDTAGPTAHVSEQTLARLRVTAVLKGEHPAGVDARAEDRIRALFREIQR